MDLCCIVKLWKLKSSSLNELLNRVDFLWFKGPCVTFKNLSIMSSIGAGLQNRLYTMHPRTSSEIAKYIFQHLCYICAAVATLQRAYYIN